MVEKEMEKLGMRMVWLVYGYCAWGGEGLGTTFRVINDDGGGSGGGSGGGNDNDHLLRSMLDRMQSVAQMDSKELAWNFPLTDLEILHVCLLQIFCKEPFNELSVTMDNGNNGFQSWE